LTACSVSVFVSAFVSVSAIKAPASSGSSHLFHAHTPALGSWFHLFGVYVSIFASASAAPLSGCIGQSPFGSFSALGNLICFISVFAGSQFLGLPNKKPVDLWISLDAKCGTKAENNHKLTQVRLLLLLQIYIGVFGKYKSEQCGT
jgi:hypothetical protein